MEFALFNAERKVVKGNRQRSWWRLMWTSTEHDINLSSLYIDKLKLFIFTFFWQHIDRCFQMCFVDINHSWWPSLTSPSHEFIFVTGTLRRHDISDFTETAQKLTRHRNSHESSDCNNLQVLSSVGRRTNSFACRLHFYSCHSRT